MQLRWSSRAILVDRDSGTYCSLLGGEQDLASLPSCQYRGTRPENVEGLLVVRNLDIRPRKAVLSSDDADI
jgi:hypothetical protein